jgi:hypothetical protein
VPVDFTSLFTADHAVAQNEHSQSVLFRAIGRGRAPFTVADAIVGDVEESEQGKIDGLLESFSTPMVVLRSQCPYRPIQGQKIVLASGRVCSIVSVNDGSDGITYPIMLRPEVNG